MNKIAIVTGASSGIGEAVSLRLAKEGYHVALIARREVKLQAVANKINKVVGSEVAFAIPADVSKQEAIDRVVQEIESELGPVHVLVNNAGLMGGAQV